MRRPTALLLTIALTGAPGVAAESSPRELLRQAEELRRGAGGTYDPETADRLFEEAAATGDPAASFRLALILELRKPKQAADARRASQLHDRSARAVEALASRGDAYAQYLMGTAALIGLGEPADHRTARLWLELAAEAGAIWAWHNLGWMMETGRGFDGEDTEAALGAYRSACEGGNVVSMLDFARLALTEDGSASLCEEGLGWLERAARAGHPGAAAFLGKLLLYGRGDCVAAAPDKAPRWLQTAAAAAEPGAHFDLGFALLTGAAGDEDRARSVAHLERAAAQLDAIAVETLALLYATGMVVRRDPSRARELMAEAARLGSDGFPRLAREAPSSRPFARLLENGARRLEKLAEEGDVHATALLANLAYRGTGVRRDPELAVRLAREAAAAGEASAMRVLGHAYGNGLGVARDPVAAVRWYRLGAEGGDSFCMMFYSQALMKGERVERDLATGLAWLTRSGEAGNWWAIADLGNLHDEGWYGLPKNRQQAARWKRLLARLGDEEASGWLAYHGYAAE